MSICTYKFILFKKHSFLHQLSQNMITDCSLNYKFSTTRKLQIQCMLCTVCPTDIGPNSRKFEYINEYGLPYRTRKFEYINEYWTRTRNWTRTRLCTQVSEYGSQKKLPTFQKKCLKRYFSLFVVPNSVVCYFAMSHGSYDSNLDSKRLILVIVIRSRSWPNIDGTYGTCGSLSKTKI